MNAVTPNRYDIDGLGQTPGWARGAYSANLAKQRFSQYLVRSKLPLPTKYLRLAPKRGNIERDLAAWPKCRQLESNQTNWHIVACSDELGTVV